TILRQELIPSVSLPAVSVVATNPGASSEQMADGVAEPLERQMRTLENIEGTSATSRSNFTTVNVELEYGADIYRAASQADALISRVEAQLPEGTTTQVVTGGSGDLPAMIISVASDLETPELSRSLDLTAISDIGSVSGVANVQLLGTADEIVRLTLDDAAMAEAAVTQADITSALDNAGLVLPGGNVNDGAMDLDVTVGDGFDTVDQLADMRILPSAEGTAPVALGEVVTVERTTAEAQSASRTDGRESITMLVTPATNANYVELSDSVAAILDEAAETIGSATEFTIVFDQAPFIQESISGLATEGAWGLGFAIVVIFLFLWALRPTIITAISIPLSLMFAFIGMLATNTTLNIMALAGLTLAIGRMVDDSIVVIENIVRHLGFSRKSRFATILDAVTEVASAVVSSTVVALLVFLPIAVVPGLAGELFRPFALTTVLALTGSLLVSLTIVPVLAYWFMRGKADKADADIVGGGDDETFVASKGWLARLYRPGLAWALSHRIVTVVLAAIVLGGSVAMFPLLKINLLGDSGMNSISASQTLPAGTVLEESVAEAEKTEEVLREVDGVESIQTTVGGSGFGFGGGSAPNEISYTITTDVEADQMVLAQEIGQALAAHQDKEKTNGDLEVADSGSLLGSDTVDVSVTALDDETRAEANEQIIDALSAIDTVSNVGSDFETSEPSLEITVRGEDASVIGLSVSDAVGLIAASTADFAVASVTIDGEDLEVYMDTGESVDTVEDVEGLDLGGFALSDIADVERVNIVPAISTVNAVRTITVSATPANSDDVGSVGDTVLAEMESLDLPEGVSWEIGGVTADVDEAFSQLALAMAAAILLIYVVLVWLFKSLIQPLILLMSIPFALTGTILALWVTGTALGLPSLVGVLMLIGIVVTNAIVLIDLVNQYRRHGMSLDDALLNGGQNRVRPIIMTAAATIMAMLPPALGLSSQSSFVSGPMAISVIGGLIASTLITLIIVPVLYRMIEGIKERYGRTSQIADDPDQPTPRRAEDTLLV
ncbi:MAG: efflux RND transporter permease subunit, partial [Arachnia sp.]